jgi:hypothetical protein
MKLKIAIFLLAFMPLTLSAGEVQGLINEFMEVEDYLSKKKPSPEFRKKMLEKNMLDSLKSTLSKKIKDPKNDLKDLKIEEVDYERQANTFKFYIRYKQYYVFYDFAMDPELFMQLPQTEIIYTRPENYDSNAPHKEEGTVMPDPGK